MKLSKFISIIEQNRASDIEKQKEHINAISQQLMDNIDRIPENLVQTLSIVEKEFIDFYNEEINQLYQNFEREYALRNWQKKQFLKREEELLKQIKWVKDISQKINNENDTLNEALKELKDSITDNKESNYNLQE